MTHALDAQALAEQAAGITGHHLDPGDGSLDDILQGLLRVIRQHLDMEIGFISELVGDRRVFRYVSANEGAELIQAGDSDPRDRSYCQYVVDGRLPQLMHNAQADPATQNLYTTHEVPVGAYLSVPIKLSDGSVHGTFCAFKQAPDPALDTVHLALVRIFADIAGALIDRNSDAITDNDAPLVDLRQRLAAGEPVAVFQPIVDLANREPVGFELLSRFPGEPALRPDHAFANASATGLANTLTRRTLERGIDALDVLPADAYIAINLSPDMVVSGNLEPLLAGMPRHRLVLEITEHAIIQDYQGVVDALAPLQSEGARLAVDDAGAGYASFRHILHLCPDIIKLDMSLVRNIDQDPNRRALAAALAMFARHGGYKLVAEGIETSTELDTLLGFGSFLGQGYLFSKPEPAEFFKVPTP